MRQVKGRVRLAHRPHRPGPGRRLRPAAGAGGRVADDAGDRPAGGRAGRWHVPDLEAKLAEVTAAGATAKEPAHDVRGGRLVATVTDPDGNVLGLLQDR